VLSAFLSESTGLQQFDFKKTMLDPEAIALVPKKDALKYQVLPVSIDHDKKSGIVAMADPYDIVALDKLKQFMPKGYHIVTQICPPVAMADIVHKAYGASTSIEGILKELQGDKEAAKKNIDTLNE